MTSSELRTPSEAKKTNDARPDYRTAPAWTSRHLTRTWLDAVVERTGLPYFSIVTQFVWMYDNEFRFSGRPFPLTLSANRTLERINKVMRSNWPTNPNAFDLDRYYYGLSLYQHGVGEF